MQSQCRIELFGGLRVRRGEQLIDRFQTQKTGALLAYLALKRSRPINRDVLADILWPLGDTEAIRNRLNQAVSSLRRQLHPPSSDPMEVIIGDRRTVSLNEQWTDVDVEDFRSAIASASIAADPREQVGFLRTAVELYVGELLPEFDFDWVIAERTTLADQYSDALETLVNIHSRSGEPDLALEYARRRLALDTLDTRANVELLELYSRADRPASVLRHFEDYERRCHQNGQQVPQVAAGIYQWAKKRPESHPVPLPKIDEVKPDQRYRREELPESRRRATVLRPGTRFFGREEEAATIFRLFDSGERLVTLLGIGGSGKTRLAIEVAERMSGRATFVAFAALTDVNGFFSEILTSIGGHLSEEYRSALPELVAKLADSNEVLILDNLEQFGTEGARRVRELLDAVPTVRLLVTSRIPLNLAEERQLSLGPLPLPNLADELATTAANPSVALFVSRAQAVRPDFGLTDRTAGPIIELCRQLEGLPLAIELAAGWMRVLTPSQILERIQGRLDSLESRRYDVPTRHRSLRAAIAGSVDLLEADEQEAFKRLSVFVGGWHIDDARAICRDDRVAALMDSLVMHSLVQADYAGPLVRYSMLEVLRLFASGELSEEVAQELNEIHAHHFLARAEKSKANAGGWNEIEDAEKNHQRAMEWFAGEHRYTEALRYAVSLAPYWEARGKAGEGLRRIEGFLQVAPADVPASVRSAALAVSGRMAWICGDYAVAQRRLTRALEGLKRVNDQPRIIETQFNLQLEAHRMGDYETVRRLLEDNLVRAEELGDQGAIARCWLSLGNASVEQFQWQEANEYYTKSLESARLTGDPDRIAQSLNNLGNLALLEGQREAARNWLNEAHDTFLAVGHRWHLGISLVALSKLDALDGDVESARARLREAISLNMEETIVVWRVVQQAAVIRTQQGDGAEAAQLFGYLDCINERGGKGKQGVEMAPHGEHLAILRTLLPASELAEQWRIGRNLSRKDLIALL